jgi:hypothetical protein
VVGVRRHQGGYGATETIKILSQAEINGHEIPKRRHKHLFEQRSVKEKSDGVRAPFGPNERGNAAWFGRVRVEPDVSAVTFLNETIIRATDAYKGLRHRRVREGLIASSIRQVNHKKIVEGQVNRNTEKKKN